MTKFHPGQIDLVGVSMKNEALRKVVYQLSLVCPMSEYTFTTGSFDGCLVFQKLLDFMTFHYYVYLKLVEVIKSNDILLAPVMCTCLSLSLSQKT